MKGPHLASFCHLFNTFIPILSVFLFAACQLTGQKILLIEDADGIPLIGAEAINASEGLYLSSDNKGQIDLPFFETAYVLEIRYLGYNPKTVNILPFSKALKLKVVLEFQANILEELIVIGRTDANPENLPYQIDIIESKDILRTQSQTTVDALQLNANVYVQKSQMGGGSPVIRGFEANKVLLVVDGVRLNNAIYRSGHLQNAITIDESMLEQMEVIYGPGSVSYGSDALGGVVHFRTKKPRLSVQNESLIFEGNYFIRSASANFEKSAHLDFNFGQKKWASLTSLSFSDYGDLRTGNQRRSDYPDFGKRNLYVSTNDGLDSITVNENPNIQIGTAYTQWDILQKFIFQPNHHLQFNVNLQHSNSSNIPRYDALTEYRNGMLRYAEWYYGPQTRNMASVQLKWEPLDKSIIDRWESILSFQEIKEARISRSLQNNWRAHQEEQVFVQSLTSDIQKTLGHSVKHLFQTGISLDLNQVSSTAFQEDIDALQKDQNIFTRYPSGGSSLNSADIYLSYAIIPNQGTIQFHSGLRYSYHIVNLEFSTTDPFQWPLYFYDGIQSTNDAWSWSGALKYEPYKTSQFQASVSSAFRAPNVDDLGKTRINGNEISVPNVDLVPEKAISGELSYTQKFKNLGHFQIVAYSTLLKDAVVRQDFLLPDGSPYYINQGDTLGIVANVNAGQARINGISAQVKIKWLPSFVSIASLNFQKGYIISENQNTPLGHIPPAFGNIKLNYILGKFEFDFQALFNGWKKIKDFGGSVDNPELATPEGSPSWIIFNSYGSYSFTDRSTIKIGIENIFDTHYRQFSSGLSSPGFNAILSFQGKF